MPCLRLHLLPSYVRFFPRSSLNDRRLPYFHPIGGSKTMHKPTTLSGIIAQSLLLITFLLSPHADAQTKKTQKAEKSASQKTSKTQKSAAQTPPTKAKKPTPAPNKKTKKQRRTHTIQFKDYFSLGYAFGGVVSPKGKHVAYTESRWQGASRNIDLWVVNTATRRRQRLTFSKAADLRPQWSADGRWIYFMSRRKAKKSDPALGKRQVWRIRPDGGRLMAVTRAPKGIHAYQLSKDGRYVYYKTAAKHVQKGPFQGLRKQFSKLRYAHGTLRAGRIWRLDLESWRTKLILKSTRAINEFQLSPNGQKLALLTAPDNKLISNEGWSRLDIYDIKSQKMYTPDASLWRKKAPSPYGWLEHPRWSPDSNIVSLHVGYDGYPPEVYFVLLKEKRSFKLKRKEEEHYEGPSKWAPHVPAFCYVGAHKARKHLYCTGYRRGKQMPVEKVDFSGRNVQDFAYSGDGKKFLVLADGQDFLIDFFFGPAFVSPKALKRLTRINPQIDTWKLPTIKKIQWKSKDGSIVEGILELPPGYKPGKPLPLVVILHGGPTWSVKQRFRFSYAGRTIFASKGWATLSPNYRGSTGYGDTFLTQLIGHKNDRDIDDILTGVQAMIKLGIADPKKLAMMGWSNGGYLVNCLITKTNIFKAASSGAGVFDLSMQWMIEDTPGHVINFNKGLPWQRSQQLQKASPLYGIHKAKTPTLIHVGQKDPRVPVAHSQGLYRSLYKYLKVPSQLLIYPGAYHGLSKRSHRLAKIKWDIRWFEYYVLGKHKGSKKKPSKKKK
ncbi:MAG TPA: S9 family peptidase [Myxococcales bacterium]|nr:S9 family peptidase [Myxococcales bacterium]